MEKLDAKTKQPYAFAGLFDAWKDTATEDWLQTLAIVTTEPNELTAEVHTRSWPQRRD